MIRLVRGGPYVPAEIVHADGEWSAIINGVLQGQPHAQPEKAPGVSKIWLFGKRIDGKEYAYRRAVGDHVAKHDPEHPLATPNQPIDLSKLKPLF